MKKLLIIILSLNFTVYMHAALQQYTLRADSLEEVIRNTSKDDTARLSAVKELARIAQSTDKGLELAQELLLEGKRHNLNRYIAFGAYYTTIYYFNHRQIDSTKHYSNIVLPVAGKEKIWVIYFDALKIRTYAYIMGENYEFALNEGLKMLNEAREINFPDGIVSANAAIATAYLATERWDEGLEHLNEAYKYLPNAKNILVSIDVLGMLISASFHTNNYPALYQYVQEFKKDLNDYLKVAPLSDPFRSYFAYTEIYLAYYYIRTGEPDKAFPHLQTVKEYLDKSNYTTDKLQYMDAIAEYYQATGQFEKAIQHLDTTLVLTKDIYMSDYYKQMVKKADIYVKIGKYNKAMSLYKTAIDGKDSINQAISNKQMDQILQIYDIDKLQFEKERLKNERRTQFLFLIILGIILWATFIIRIIFVKRRLKKAEKEIRKASAVANETNDIKERFLSNMSYNIRTPLNNVVGFSQLLSIEPDMDEELRNEYSSIIKKNSEKLMSLVNKVLDLSRLESGMMKFNMGKSGISSLCNDALYTANQKNNGLISVITDIQAPDAEISTDYNRFLMTLSSTLTYPVPSQDKREVTLSIKKNNDNINLRFEIINSPLADPTFTTQEVSVCNEINRLFIEHFGGTYRVNNKNSSLPPTIVFTYPLSIS